MIYTLNTSREIEYIRAYPYPIPKPKDKRKNRKEIVYLNSLFQFIFY